MSSLVKRAVITATVILMTSACSLTATGDPSNAATVGDVTIPAAEIDETLAMIRDSEAFRQQSQGDTSGDFVLDAQTQIVTQFVRSEILALVAEELDLVITDEEVDAARDDLIEQVGGQDAYEAAIAQQGLTEQFVLRQLRDQQTQALLQAEIGDTANLAEFIQEQVADITVEVNPRYGQWDPANLSVAPFDPLPLSQVADAVSPSESP